MLFYDNGAAIGIILGAIAHKLRLEIVDKCRQAISGAANMLHHSPYGKYALRLGPLRDGSFHRITMVGLKNITYNVPRYDLGKSGMDLESEVKAHCQKFGLELPAGVYPKEIGGGGAGMVLGVKTPRLLPKTKFILPSGLMVAETEIEDIWGSRIVFGGTLKQITDANECAGIHFASVMGQSFYSIEYQTFKDSIFGNINMKNWDSDVDFSPIIITEDDTEESCKIDDCSDCKDREEFRDARDISLCLTNELRTD